ncbi:MAG: rod shape-determining protein MreC [Clostridia bacterium]|nr:rod shape-determining protein MreC [Clostridia bacterium]
MNRNKQTEIFGIIITVVLLILLIFLSNVEAGKLSFLETAVSKVFNPIQKTFNDLNNKIHKNEEYFRNYDQIREENEALKEENSALLEQLRELESLKADNATLQEYMNLTQKYSQYSTIPANIISRDVSNFGSNLVLNVGTNDGVQENMTVIADKGLVGHVLSCTDKTCKVQVIIDSASTVSCNLSTTNETIICKGTLDNNQDLRATYIPLEVDLIKGDSVVTSGVGGIYHKGIFIGTIKEIVTTNNVTDRYAIVEPAVDFSKLNAVLVIKDN